jgi:AbrB family looped-hinge helix DNA binding protein
MELTIDKAGRIVIPKSVRDNLNLRPGDKLELDDVGGSLELRPVKPKAQIRRKNGRWVFNSGMPDWDIQAAIDRDREERIRELTK